MAGFCPTPADQGTILWLAAYIETNEKSGDFLFDNEYAARLPKGRTSAFPGCR
jgi:hypothetical protein